MNSSLSSFAEYVEIVNSSATVKWKNHFHDLSCRPTCPEHARSLCNTSARVPLPRDCHSAVPLTATSCLVHGGWIRMGEEGDQEHKFDDVWQWDAMAGKWAQLCPSGVQRFSHVAQCIPTPAVAGASVSPKQVMIVLGGKLFDPETEAPIAELRPMLYDPGADRWMTPVPMLRVRGPPSFDCGALEDSSDTARTVPSPEPHQYRHYRRPLPERSFFSSIVHKDVVVSYGGLGAEEGECWDNVLCLKLELAENFHVNLSDDDDDDDDDACMRKLVAVVWDPLPTGDGPGKRFGHSVCVCNDKMFLYGGTTPDQDEDDGFYSLDLHTFVWSSIDVLMSPPCRYLHAMLQASCDSFIIVGGRYVDEEAGIGDPEMYIFSVSKEEWRCFVSHEGPFPKALCSSTLVVCKPHDHHEGISALLIGGELQDDCTNAVVEMHIAKSELEVAFDTPEGTDLLGDSEALDGNSTEQQDDDDNDDDDDDEEGEDDGQGAYASRHTCLSMVSSGTKTSSVEDRRARSQAAGIPVVASTHISVQALDSIISSTDSTGRLHPVDHRSISSNSSLHTPAISPHPYAAASMDVGDAGAGPAGSVGPSSGASRGGLTSQGQLHTDMTAQTSSVHSALMTMMPQLHHLIGFRFQEVESRLEDTNRRSDRLRDAVLGAGGPETAVPNEQRVVNAMLLEEIRGLRFQMAAISGSGLKR